MQLKIVEIAYCIQIKLFQSNKTVDTFCLSDHARAGADGSIPIAVPWLRFGTMRMMRKGCLR